MATTKKTEDVKVTAVEAEKAAETKAPTKKTCAKKTCATKAAEAKTTEKKEEVKAEIKTEAKKETKKVETKKAPAKKTPAKKAEVSKAVFVEFAGKQTVATEIVDKCVAAFKAENKNKAVKSVEVYIKPDENVAYYVINGVAEGKFVEL